MDKPMHRLAIGKRQEYIIWARLLKEGFDIYPSLVDDKGIDAIVGYDGNYFEVQVKSGQNWANQRGFDFDNLNKNNRRIYLVFNYSNDQVRFFTAGQILSEPEWAESIKWGKLSQIKLPKRLLEKYQDHDWAGLYRHLKSKVI